MAFLKCGAELATIFRLKNDDREMAEISAKTRVIVRVVLKMGDAANLLI